MITLNTRKLSEMMEASGAKIIHAHEAVRKDVEASKVDAKHQAELLAVREVDDILLNAFLINNHETMQAAVEYLLQELLEVPASDDDSAVYSYLHKAREIKELLQYGS